MVRLKDVRLTWEEGAGPSSVENLPVGLVVSAWQERLHIRERQVGRQHRDQNYVWKEETELNQN